MEPEIWFSTFANIIDEDPQIWIDWLLEPGNVSLQYLLELSKYIEKHSANESREFQITMHILESLQKRLSRLVSLFPYNITPLINRLSKSLQSFTIGYVHSALSGE